MGIGVRDRPEPSGYQRFVEEHYQSVQRLDALSGPPIVDLERSEVAQHACDCCHTEVTGHRSCVAPGIRTCGIGACAIPTRIVGWRSLREGLAGDLPTRWNRLAGGESRWRDGIHGAIIEPDTIQYQRCFLNYSCSIPT